LEFSGGRAALAIFVDGTLRRLRDFSARQATEAGRLDPGLAAQINCTVARAERDLDVEIERLYVIAQPSVVQECRSALIRRVHAIDFSRFIRNRTPADVSVDDLSWALGLLSVELLGRRKAAEKLIDFRKGAFAHQAAWRTLWTAIQSEIFPICLAIFFGIGWYVSTIYQASAALGKVEQRIDELLQEAMPGEVVPDRREVTFVQDRVAALEEQLRGMGSLSSLSPLESLKELSATIGREIDIEVEALNIGHSRLSFRGSVADNPSLGRLNSALESRKDRFCQVKLEPKGRVANSSRVKFSAEIELCE
ncbi:MAG: hypothetical protein KDD69_19230, partial [Bdellovibrionales bacterium]|nr:hypothetical protein [Bdellovibrionales bacterium]